MSENPSFVMNAMTKRLAIFESDSRRETTPRIGMPTTSTPRNVTIPRNWSSVIRSRLRPSKSNAHEATARPTRELTRSGDPMAVERQRNISRLR